MTIERQRWLVDSVESPRRIQLIPSDRNHTIGFDGQHGAVLRQSLHLRRRQRGRVTREDRAVGGHDPVSENRQHGRLGGEARARSKAHDVAAGDDVAGFFDLVGELGAHDAVIFDRDDPRVGPQGEHLIVAEVGGETVQQGREAIGGGDAGASQIGDDPGQIGVGAHGDDP